MIFVTIGTTERFDRLLAGVAGLAGDEELVVQCGDSPLRPVRATCVEFLPYDRLVDLVDRASVVVAHAGVGTILTCLRQRKRPIIVPRRAAFGEAVDDHQVELSARLDELGLVTVVQDPADLADVVRVTPREPAPPSAASGDAAELVVALRAYLEHEVRRPTRRLRLAEPHGS